MAKEEKKETLNQIQYHYDKAVGKVNDLVDEADKLLKGFEDHENYDSAIFDERCRGREFARLNQMQAEQKIREAMKANEQLKAKAIESRPVDQQDTVLKGFENRKNCESVIVDEHFCDRLLDELDQMPENMEDLELGIPSKDRTADVAKKTALKKRKATKKAKPGKKVAKKKTTRWKATKKPAEPKIRETLETYEQLKEKAIGARPVDQQDAILKGFGNYDSVLFDEHRCDRLLDELDQMQADAEDLELGILSKDRTADVAKKAAPKKRKATKKKATKKAGPGKKVAKKKNVKKKTTRRKATKKQADPEIMETLETNEQLKEKAIESRPVEQQYAVPEEESQTPEQISEPEAAQEQVTKESQVSEDETIQEQVAEEEITSSWLIGQAEDHAPEETAQEQVAEESQVSEDETAQEQVAEESQVSEDETAQEQVAEEFQASEDETAQEQVAEESQASEDETAQEQVTAKEEVTSSWFIGQEKDHVPEEPTVHAVKEASVLKQHDVHSAVAPIMKRNSKSAILIVLATAAVFIWMSNSKEPTAASASTSSFTFDQLMPVIHVVPRKRTEFIGWPRDPFAKSQEEGKREKKVISVSDLKLGAIMLDGKNLSAFISGRFVSAGDKIDNKTVKKVERDRVILTDETNDYVLKLNE